MAWYVKPGGVRVETTWDKRLNVQQWIKDEHGNDVPIPHTCEFCGGYPALYGDPEGIHCIPCWVAKKSPV